MANTVIPRGSMVIAWHPESPGMRVTVWRPWWKRKRNPWASTAEVLRSYRPVIDATKSTILGWP